MAKTQEFDNVTKAWSRVHLLKFILKSFKSHKKRKDLRVFFLPGEKALDYYEVFEKAGINPDNVIGIEREKKYYEKLLEGRSVIDPETGEESKIDHPFHIERKDAKTYFEEMAKNNDPNELFDIISLDYTGQLTPEVSETLDIIFQNNLLNPQGGIFHTNFYGMQEKDAVKDMYKHFGRSIKDITIPLEKMYNDLNEKQLKFIEDQVYDPDDLTEARNKGISIILHTKYSGSGSAYNDKSGKTELLEIFMMKANEANDHIFDRNCFINPLGRHNIPLNFAASLLMVIRCRHLESYFSESDDVFDYISPSRSHMYSDIYFLKQRPYRFSLQEFPFYFDWMNVYTGMFKITLIDPSDEFEKFICVLPLRFVDDEINKSPTKFFRNLRKYGKKANESFRDVMNIEEGLNRKRTAIPHKGLTCSNDDIHELTGLEYTIQEIDNLCPNLELSDIEEYFQKIKRERRTEKKRKVKTRGGKNKGGKKKKKR